MTAPDSTVPPNAAAEVDETGGAQEVRFSDGEHIFYEGEESDFAYTVVAGKVDLLKDTGHGAVHLRTVQAGEMFGEMGVIDGSMRSSSAVAASDVVLKRMDVMTVLRRMEEEPLFSMALVHRLIFTLRETNERLAHQHFVTTELKEGKAHKTAQLGVGGFGRRLRGLFRFRDDLAEFQPDAVEIEHRPFPAVAKLTLYVIVAFFVVAVVWSTLAKIESAIIAPGRVTTVVPNIVVQPIETAVILSIQTEEGELVQEGQVLATLDATFAEADVQASKMKLLSIDAQQRRLEAELNGTVPAVFSDKAGASALQREIFDRRRAEYNASLASWDERIQQLLTDIAINAQDAKDIAVQVDVLSEIEGMRNVLMERGHGSRVHYLSAKHQRLSMEREQRRLQSTRSRLQHQLEATRADRRAFVSERRSRVAEELVGVRRQREELSEKLKKMERRETLVQLVAPARGIVLDVADRSVGSVIRQAEPLFTLVPVGVPLRLEADIAPKDVGKVQVGNVVRIKLDALPFHKHGMQEGKVVLVSEDTLEASDQGGVGQVYRVKIDLIETELRDVPPDFRLIPGMSGTVEISVGKRSVISYVFDPITRAMSASLREP